MEQITAALQQVRKDAPQIASKLEGRIRSAEFGSSRYGLKRNREACSDSLIQLKGRMERRSKCWIAGML